MATTRSIDLNAIETEEIKPGLTSIYYKGRMVGTIEERRSTIWVASAVNPDLGTSMGNSMFGELDAAVEWMVLKVAPIVDAGAGRAQRAGTFD